MIGWYVIYFKEMLEFLRYKKYFDLEDSFFRGC